MLSASKELALEIASYLNLTMDCFHPYLMLLGGIILLKNRQIQ